MPAKKKASKKKVRKIGRDAGTGKFASKEQVKCDPDGTVTESVPLPKKTAKKKAAKKKSAKKPK